MNPVAKISKENYQIYQATVNPVFIIRDGWVFMISDKRILHDHLVNYNPEVKKVFPHEQIVLPKDVILEIA